VNGSVCSGREDAELSIHHLLEHSREEGMIGGEETAAEEDKTAGEDGAVGEDGAAVESTAAEEGSGYDLAGYKDDNPDGGEADLLDPERQQVEEEEGLEADNLPLLGKVDRIYLLIFKNSLPPCVN
jgi:hypothetical protein